jgi:ribosomal protein L27
VLSLSAGTVTYGHEQAERLRVTVTPQYSGTPGGTVAVKTGTITVCTIRLASGRGGCTLTARKLGRGTHTLFAAYPGSGDFTGSASARKTLRVR